MSYPRVFRIYTESQNDYTNQIRDIAIYKNLLNKSCNESKASHHQSCRSNNSYSSLLNKRRIYYSAGKTLNNLKNIT